MKQAQRAFLRRVMQLAWDLFKTDRDGRTFADALQGAWRWTKRQSTARRPDWTRGSAPRHVSFGTMLQSPIRRSLGAQPYAGARARQAGYLTSTLGR